MILNTGLDAACVTQSNFFGIDGNAASPAPYFAQFVRYAAIGTGSTTPDPTDTTLDSQVGSRTDNRGGFNNTENWGRGSGRIWYEATFTRVFNISSNVNAAEWGLAAATSGNLSVRDLLRADPNDPMSSPITLTLEDGDQLQLVITLRVEADWAYQTKSFVITGAPGNDTNGTHEGNATVTNGAQTSDNIRRALRCAWPGGLAAGQGALHAIMSDQTAQTISDNLTEASGASTSTLTSETSYTPGDYYRDVNYVLSTAQANGNIYAVNVGPASGTVGLPGITNASTGYRFILTDPPYLTKQNTHRLTLTVRKAIARL